jgi:hypothetical protein
VIILLKVIGKVKNKIKMLVKKVVNKFKPKVKSTEKQTFTFTKKWTNRILWCGLFWITCSYILAFLGKADIAESLSETVATIIIGTFIPYLCKAFFETYAEKSNALKAKELDKKKNTDNEE